MHRTHDERITTQEAAKNRKREIIRQMGMDPDECRRIKRIKDCTRFRRDRVNSRTLINEFLEEQDDAAVA